VIVLLEVLAVLAVVFGVAVVLTGRTDGMSEEAQDLADTGIPRDRAMTPQDVIGLRFALAFRGYRMSEVDDALDRLAAEIAARDEAIERLRSERAPYVPSDATGDVPFGVIPDVVPAPDAGEPDGYEPEFREPEPADPPFAAPGAAEPEPPLAAEPEPPAVPEPVTSPIFASLTPPPGEPSPFRPEVPEIPTYDPWSVTPRSRYTEGPTYVEVDDHPEDDVEAITEHQTGYALPPPPAPEAAAAEADEAEAADEAGDEPDQPPRSWPS
jgi:DivIVA domain-containing protein